MHPQFFLDVDASHNLDKKKFFNFIRNETFVRNKLTFNKKTKKQIKAIIITHMWGNSFFDLELYNLCKIAPPIPPVAPVKITFKFFRSIICNIFYV